LCEFVTAIVIFDDFDFDETVKSGRQVPISPTAEKEKPCKTLILQGFVLVGDASFELATPAA